jgi:hypothetical protein
MALHLLISSRHLGSYQQPSLTATDLSACINNCIHVIVL